MKNFLLMILVGVITYSCVTSKTPEEKIADSSFAAQKRIEILKEAESSSNPAILKQAEIIKYQIDEERKQQQRDEHFEKYEYWYAALCLVCVLLWCSSLMYIRTGRWPWKK